LKPDLPICFYFPFEEDSGVPVLFARMANELAIDNPDINFYFIDYENGAIARNTLKVENIILIPFKDGVDVSPPENVILVMQSFVPYHWPKELKPLPGTKIFFWNLHPKNFIPSLLPIAFLRDLTYNNFAVYKSLSWFFPGTINKISGFVKLLLEHKSLCFMDETNYESTKKFLFLNDFVKEYLPVPVSGSNTGKRKINRQDYLLHVNYCWVGRICDFKAYILVYTANKLSKIAKENAIHINYFIVGDGPFTAYVKENVLENSHFKVIYKGGMPHAGLDEFLLSEIDVVTAMGTSALEGAKLGIPTILLDFSYEKITGDYIFRSLYEIKNYDLGHSIGKKDMSEGNKSLENIVLTILENYKEEADKAFNYYLNNHTSKAVGVKFIELSNNSNLNFGAIDAKLLEKPKILEYYYNLKRIVS
jgi:hypothetical protein